MQEFAQNVATSELVLKVCNARHRTTSSSLMCLAQHRWVCPSTLIAAIPSESARPRWADASIHGGSLRDHFSSSQALSTPLYITHHFRGKQWPFSRGWYRASGVSNRGARMLSGSESVRRMDEALRGHSEEMTGSACVTV